MIVMIWTMVEWLLLLGISKKVPISLLESRLIQRDSPPIPPSLQLSKQILQIGKTSWESDTNHMTYHINTMQLIEAHNRHFFFARFDSVEGNGLDCFQRRMSSRSSGSISSSRLPCYVFYICQQIKIQMQTCPVGRAAASRQPFDRSKPKPVLAVKNTLNISKDKICNDVSSTFHHLYALLNIW